MLVVRVGWRGWPLWGGSSGPGGLGQVFDFEAVVVVAHLKR